MNLIHDALGHLPSGPPSAPPDLDTLVDELRIELRYTKSRRLFDGATDLTGARPVIELAWLAPSSSRSMIPWGSGDRVAANLPHHYDARTRFTLAHEIGHVLLERTPALSDQVDALSPAELERACDRFAAELLMPRNWFCTEVGAAPDLASLRRTALRARVSMSSTIVRARNLRYGIVGLFLSARPSYGWHIARSFGLHRTGAFQLGASSLGALESTPMKTVIPTRLPVRCGGHNHELSGQLRRTFASAVVIVQHLDSTTPPAPYTWRCHH